MCQVLNPATSLTMPIVDHYTTLGSWMEQVLLSVTRWLKIKLSPMPCHLTYLFWGIRLSFLHFEGFCTTITFWFLGWKLVTSNLHFPSLTWVVVECSWRLRRINCSGHFGLLGGRGGRCGFPWKWSSYQLGWCSCIYWPLWLLLFWTCGFP